MESQIQATQSKTLNDVDNEWKTMSNYLVGHKTFSQKKLIEDFPPQLHHPKKQLLFDLCYGPNTSSLDNSPPLVYSRWTQMKSDRTFITKLSPTSVVISPANELFVCRENAFDYQKETDMGENVMEWWANFAHSILFVAYGGPLFAQDEMQVGEHPVLGSLRESLRTVASTQPELKPVTREGKAATPILIRGIERRCHVKINPNASEGRPYGLYGNNFARTSDEAINKATTVLNPPTITNMFAMEAPHGGYGTYQKWEINDIFFTAFTAFTATRLESYRALLDDSQKSENAPKSIPKVVVHTGNWGTGAYGGNKILMALLQMLAGRMSQVDRVVFHTFAPDGTKAFNDALKIYKRLVEEGEGREVSIPDTLNEIFNMNFKWGVSDGN